MASNQAADVTDDADTLSILEHMKASVMADPGSDNIGSLFASMSASLPPGPEELARLSDLLPPVNTLFLSSLTSLPQAVDPVTFASTQTTVLSHQEATLDPTSQPTTLAPQNSKTHEDPTPAPQIQIPRVSQPCNDASTSTTAVTTESSLLVNARPQSSLSDVQSENANLLRTLSANAISLLTSATAGQSLSSVGSSLRADNSPRTTAQNMPSATNPLPQSSLAGTSTQLSLANEAKIGLQKPLFSNGQQSSINTAINPVSSSSAAIPSVNASAKLSSVPSFSTSAVIGEQLAITNTSARPSSGTTSVASSSTPGQSAVGVSRAPLLKPHPLVSTARAVPPTSTAQPRPPVHAVLLPKPQQQTSTSTPNIAQIISSVTVSQVPPTLTSRPFPAKPGQVTAEILTNFQPPKSSPSVSKSVPTDNKLPSLRMTAGEILASVTGLTEARTARVGTPTLQANETMISDDELSDEEMDTQQATTETGENHTSSRGVEGSSRSDSPYADDDSFADFLAREVDETALEGSSRSPTPTHDLHMVKGQGSHGPGLRRFGVTASCPPAPVQLPDGAANASLDMTARNFPKRSKYAHRAAISAMHPYNRTRGGGASVAKTLDLLKAVLQSSFNMEVKRLCDDYLSIFSLAATNIRDNTGDSVPEATLRLLVCKMIEEAQQGYVQGKWEFPYGKLPLNEKVMNPSGSPMSAKKLKTERVESRYGPPKRIRKPPADRGADKAVVWKWGMDKRRLDPGKWEPDKMNLGTVFCLGVNVNKALGHAANRGKVYYLHPELFKYACDGDDKTWLYENKYLPVHGGKAFLMIYQEVAALVSNEELYKDDPEIVSSVAKLQQFKVPQFMIDKMKTFMKSVQGYFAQEASNTSSATKS